MPAPKVVSLSPLVPEKHDYVALTYDGDNLTIARYYDGGASGTLVATLTLVYSGTKITTITRT